MKLLYLIFTTLSLLSSVQSMENNNLSSINNEGNKKQICGVVYRPHQNSSDNFIGKKTNRKESNEEQKQKLEEQYNKLESKLFYYSYNDSFYTQKNSKYIKNIRNNKPNYYDVICSIEDIFNELIGKIKFLGCEETLQIEPTLRQIELNDTIEFAKIFDRFQFISNVSNKRLSDNNERNIKKYIKTNEKLHYNNELSINKFCSYICIQLIKLKYQTIKMISTQNNINEIIPNFAKTLHDFYSKLVNFFDLTYRKNQENINNPVFKYHEEYFSNTGLSFALYSINDKLSLRLNELQYYNIGMDKKFQETHNTIIYILNKLKEEPNISECKINNIYNISTRLINKLDRLLKSSVCINDKDKLELKEFFVTKIQQDSLTKDFLDNLIEKINVLYKVVCNATQKQYSTVHKINYYETIMHYYLITYSILRDIYNCMFRRDITNQFFSGDGILTMNESSKFKYDIELYEVQNKLFNFNKEFFPSSRNNVYSGILEYLHYCKSE